MDALVTRAFDDVTLVMDAFEICAFNEVRLLIVALVTDTFEICALADVRLLIVALVTDTFEI